MSAHVPAPATNRQNVVIKRGMSETAVCPVWDGITLIPDEITKAANGQIVITAYMLFAMKVLRTGAGLGKARHRPFLISYSLDRLGAARPSKPEKSCRRLLLLW